MKHHFEEFYLLSINRIRKEYDFLNKYLNDDFIHYKMLELLCNKFGSCILPTKSYFDVDFRKELTLVTNYTQRKIFETCFKTDKGYFIPSPKTFREYIQEKRTYQKETFVISDNIKYAMSYNDNVDESLVMEKLIPEIDDNFVPFGDFDLLKNIIESNIFLPVFISGDSGYGKTLSVEQACAQSGRELIRVPISPETDKTQLLVVPNLNNGNLTYENGPVLTAMERGSLLLLDEIDRGSINLICLNGILEGKPFYNEKTQKMIHPKNGFNVIATANSKGTGDNIKYLVNVLDNAFLERFVINLIQQPPPTDVEISILKNEYQKYDGKDLDYKDQLLITTLVTWASHTRQDERNSIAEDSISTRRLVDIIKMCFIVGRPLESVKLCCNRFSEKTCGAFVDLFKSYYDEEITNNKKNDLGMLEF